MTARLRVLPVYNGERGQHYLVLDRASGWTLDRAQQAASQVEGRLREAGGTFLVFADEVEIPEADAPAETTPEEETPYTITLDAGESVQGTAAQVHRAIREHGRALVRYG